MAAQPPPMAATIGGGYIRIQARRLPLRPQFKPIKGYGIRGAGRCLQPPEPRGPPPARAFSVRHVVSGVSLMRSIAFGVRLKVPPDEPVLSARGVS